MLCKRKVVVALLCSNASCYALGSQRPLVPTSFTMLSRGLLRATLQVPMSMPVVSMLQARPDLVLAPCAEAILQLASTVLGVSTIMVSLLDGYKKFVRNATGFVSSGAAIEPPAICHWSLVPQVHQMVVVEDTLLDARCATWAFLTSKPCKFYNPETLWGRGRRWHAVPW